MPVTGSDPPAPDRPVGDDAPVDAPPAPPVAPPGGVSSAAAARPGRVRRGRLALVAVVSVAVLSGLLVTAAVVLPPARDDRDASAAFVAAWERSRTGTYVTESTFERTLGDGRTLYSPTALAQRPPDRIIRQFGGVVGQRDGHEVSCATEPAGGYYCTEAERTLPPFDEQLAGELTALRSYFQPGVLGADLPALYRARYDREEGCFRLVLQLDYPDAEYGRFARFCFDDSTGAVRYLERRLPGGVVEVTRATSISATVTPDDLSTEEDPGYQPAFDAGALPIGPAGTTSTTAAPGGIGAG